MTLRQPIVCVLGHVDHGKTKILDKIRGSAIQTGEAGGITQAIGASIIPINIIKTICGRLLGENSKFTIPGLLFIDTPGHAAFTNLRKRGGNLADIAILVIDLNEGLKPQTIESIEILRSFKTPFIIAANKVDLIPGYKKKSENLIQNITSQDPLVQEKIDIKLYEIVGKLSEMGLNSERFDRVEDYTQQVAIVPTSAKSGDGIPELLMVLIGLAQKYLESTIKFHIGENAKGSVLEVKESEGLGKTMDVIIYDGKLRKGDSLMIGGKDGPITTKVKALFQPGALCEIRDRKSKFCSMEEVVAATGVKISAPMIDDVIAGMPIKSYTDKTYDAVLEEIQSEVSEVLITTDKTGLIVKADTLGSLEALILLLKEKGIAVRKADVGKITKKDISDAEINYDKDPLQAVILGFNVEKDSDVASSDKVKIITNNIIYKILVDLELWQDNTKKRLEANKLDLVIRPCKMQIMPNYVFRQSNPAIVGMDILEGKVKVGTRVMKAGKTVATVKSIQEDKENRTEIVKGKQVAMALDGCCVGRQIEENDILYSYIPEPDFRKIKKLVKYLSKGEIEVLKEIVEMMRVTNPVWGI